MSAATRLRTKFHCDRCGGNFTNVTKGVARSANHFWCVTCQEWRPEGEEPKTTITSRFLTKPELQNIPAPDDFLERMMAEAIRKALS